MKKTLWYARSNLNFFWVAAKRFIVDDFSNHASALAFVTVLSIVPLVSVIVYIFSFFPEFDNLVKITKHYIYSNFVPTSGQTIQQYFSQFTHQASNLPIISIIFSIFTAVMFVMTIEYALNAVWHVTHKAREYFSILLVSVLIVLLPLFIGLVALTSELVFSFLHLADFQYITVSLLNFFINATCFAILYLILPNEKISWRNAFFGGLLVSFLFDISKSFFVMYIKKFATYEYIYGALSLVPIFLLWIYIVWCIILYGALTIYAKHQKDIN